MMSEFRQSSALTAPRWRLGSHHIVEDPENDNIDVWVDHNGVRFRATLFTTRNVKALMDKWLREGTQSARYFWATDAIIVERLDENVVREMVEDLIDNDQLSQAMSPVESDEPV